MIKMIKRDEIPEKITKGIEIRRDLDEFMSSGADAAIVTVPEGRRVDSTYAAYRNEAIRNGYHTIKVMLRKGQVCLVRKDA